jgi:hypothetical protein
MRMIQQGVSDAGRAEGSSNANAMDVGRVMDWIEARLEAIRAREEEEDEEEERERARATPKPAATTIVQPPSSPPAPAIPRTVSALEPRPRTAPPASPTIPTATPSSALVSSTPAPPRLASLPPRTPKARPIAGPSTTLVSFPSGGHDSTPDVADIGAGAKRRHAVMMMLDSGSPAAVEVSSPASTPGLSRRRTRSSRALALSTARDNEQMEVEDDGGRERKRVARR